MEAAILVAGLDMSRTRRGGQRDGFAAFVVVSIAAHVATAAYFVTTRPVEWGHGVIRDVIEVSLVDEVRVARADVSEGALPLTPALAEPAPTDPTPVAERSTAEPDRPVETAQQPTVEPTLLTLPSLPPPTAVLADARVIEAAALPIVPPPPPITTVPVNAAASASAGDLEHYARSVALAISRTRPRGIGRTGRVEIEFTVAETGRTLDRALVVRSSGNAKLDTLAHDAIKRALFPSAPAGASVAQRTFQVPFNFE